MYRQLFAAIVENSVESVKKSRYSLPRNFFRRRGREKQVQLFVELTCPLCYNKNTFKNVWRPPAAIGKFIFGRPAGGQIKELFILRWIDRLEQKYRRVYIPNLTLAILAGMVLVFVMQLIVLPMALRNGAYIDIASFLGLDRAAVLNGEIWRIITFLFIPRSMGLSLGTVLNFYFVYYIGREVESRWSGFRYTLYFLMGWLCAVAAMFVGGVGTNHFMLLSFFLAFATLAGDNQIMLFYVLPIKAKWLGLLYLGFVVYEIYTYFVIAPQFGIAYLISFLFSLVPYLLFFGPVLWQGVLEFIRVRQWRQKNR